MIYLFIKEGSSISSEPRSHLLISTHVERSQFPQIYSDEKNATRITLSLEDAIAGYDRRLFVYLIEGKMLLIESILMCVTESRVKILHTVLHLTDLVT